MSKLNVFITSGDTMAAGGGRLAEGPPAGQGKPRPTTYTT
jgi:hypothetical protein